jgi:DNA-binding IclR family transcriptional regulator
MNRNTTTKTPGDSLSGAREASEAESSDRYRAPALDKGLDILELLSEQPHGLTRGEIVKAMGRSPSEIYRMLERLVARHYVSRSPEGDRYALSLKLFVLAHRHPPVERLAARARPAMEAFANAVEQSCHLSVYDRGNLTVVAQVSSPGKLGFSLRLGARVSLVDTASGQVLLAFQKEERRAEMLAAHEALEGEIPLGEGELAAELQRVRNLGYWQGESRQSFGITDISVPVLAPGGVAIAALTCPHVRRIDRHGGAAVDEVRERLAETAHDLSLE